MTKKRITPTVGRHVHFQLTKTSPINAAIIANVNEGGTVNLAIFDTNGKPMAGPPTSVPLVQPGEEPPAQGYFCQWMPWQVENEAETAIAPSSDAGQAKTGGVDEGTAEGSAAGAGSDSDAKGTDADADQAGANGGQHAASKTDGSSTQTAPTGA